MKIVPSGRKLVSAQEMLPTCSRRDPYILHCPGIAARHIKLSWNLLQMNCGQACADSCSAVSNTDSAKCREWAAAGECSKNPAFMLKERDNTHAHNCTHTHTHVPFLYFMLHSFNLFYIYSRLSRHFMSSEVGHLNQLQMDSARSVPTLVHLRNGRWMNAKNGLARANAIGIPNSCCRSALPYAAI